MAEYLEEMRKAKDSKLVPVIEFMQICDPKDKDRVHCFVEADMDKLFYNSKIRNIAGSNPSTHLCRRKQLVIDVYADLLSRSEYNLVRKGYFVDKDFDETPLPTEIYVTPHYSLENFFTQKSTVEVILEEIFKMTPGSDDFLKSLGFYEKLQKQFHKEILLLNVFLICQYKTHHLLGATLNVDSRMAPVLKKIVSEDLNYVHTFHEISSKKKIEDFFGVTEVAQVLWDASLASLAPHNLSSSLRGKFELEFLYSFMDQLANSVKSNKSGIWKNTYKPHHVEKKQILLLLADKVLPAKCLREYILLLVI